MTKGEIEKILEENRHGGRCGMDKKEVEKFLDEKVNWVDVHKKMVFCPYETKICIWADGKITELSFEENLSDEEWKKVVGVLRANGVENINTSDYLDKWLGEKDCSTSLFLAIMACSLHHATLPEIISKAIQKGEWSDLYREWKEIILEA